MESYSFIESGIVFGLNSYEALSKISFLPTDLAIHRDGLSFVLDYFDEHKNFPEKGILCQRFPDLEESAYGINFDYALNVFAKQRAYRKAVEVLKTNSNELKQEPLVAIGKILEGLDRVIASFDDNVSSYGDTAELRYSSYVRKKNQKQKGLQVLGIPTMFRSVNKTGVGWLPGDLISILARPTVGKTWMCVKSASSAIMNNCRTLLISSEMPKEQLEIRLDVVLGQATGYEFSHTALRSGGLINEEKYREYLTETKKRFSDLIVCDNIDRKAISLSGIGNLIRKHKPEFIVLDALHLISGSSKSQIWEKMFELFYGIKNLSTANGIATMVTTQANRKVESMYEPPSPSEVAFGDAMFQSSDAVFSMCMVKGTETQRMARLIKYRDGVLPFEDVFLEWKVDNGIIKELV